MTTETQLAAALSTQGLMVSGWVPDGDCTIWLISPDEPTFWAVLTAAPEFLDGATDPVDRWSARVIREIAYALGGTAIFPSDGPPYPPFYSWAIASGRFAASPVRMLVHDVAGLFTSFRGAIRLEGNSTAPSPSANPCSPCDTRPCLTACPVDALGADGYDVARCHAHLDTPAGADCLTGGCLVRRACPVGQSRRLPQQSAHHMGYFHR